MTTSSFVSMGFAAIVGIAACTPATVEPNAERTAACTDRTNSISCDSCCKTESITFANNVCTCKGKAVEKK
jgi:hypothetical protein